MKLKIVTLLSIGIFTLPLTFSLQAEEWAADRYKRDYQTLGFLLRSFSVCPDATEDDVSSAFSIVSDPEYVALSKGYPETTKEWMSDGGAYFNDSVMKNGLPSACREAQSHLSNISGGR